MQSDSSTLPRLVENPVHEDRDSQVIRDLPELPASPSADLPEAPPGSHAAALMHWAGEVVKAKREVVKVEELINSIKKEELDNPTLPNSEAWHFRKERMDFWSYR